MNYLDSITLTKTLPCLAEPGRIIVIGKPNRQLDEVIPYLATLPGVIAYNPETRTLTFRRPHGFMTLYADKVYITQVVDSTEGLQLFDALKEAINITWEKREELIAVTSKETRPAPPGHLGVTAAYQLRRVRRVHMSGVCRRDHPAKTLSHRMPAVAL